MPKSASKKTQNKKKETETVSSTVPGDKSQKDKKSNKKTSRSPRQNISKNILVQDDKQQKSSASVPKPNPQTELKTAPNFNDFPQLVRKNKSSVSESSQFQKSWRSHVGGKGNGDGSNEAFPKLPYVGIAKKKKDNSTSKKNEPEKTSCKQEKPEKANISSASKKEGRVKAESSSKKLTQLDEKTQIQRNPMKKKRADPVLINLKEILEVNKAHRKTKEHKTVKPKSHWSDNTEKLSGNILDSSNPKRSKGKHREIKKKKLTNLKLVILKERIIKQKAKEFQVNGSPGNSFSDFIENINFKEEIKKYLIELDEKKIKVKDDSEDKSKQNIEAGVNIEEVVEKFNKEELKVGCLKEKNNCSLKKSNEESESKTEEEKDTLFSCKVREYCENIITPALNSAVTEMIKEVVSLQDKLFARDPVKAKAKKRHVSGFREVKKFLKLKKVKIIVIPPNLEKLQMKGSVFDLISELKEMAKIQNVPYVFALDRHKLGKYTKKNVPVGAFAILNYEGLQEQFKNVLTHLQEARQDFEDIMSKTRVKIEGENTEEDRQQINDTVLKAIMREKKESKEENSDEEDTSRTVSSFLASLRELSTNN